MIPKGTAAYYSAKAAPGAILLITTPVLLRIAGSREFAAYAVSLLTASVGASVGGTWLRQSYLRFLDQGTVGRYWVGEVSSVGVALVAASMLAGILGGEAAVPWPSVGVLGAALCWNSIGIARLQVPGRAGSIVAVEVTRVSLTVALPVVLHGFGMPIRGSTLTILTAISCAVSAASSLPFTGRGRTRPATPVQMGVRPMVWLRYGVPMSVWATAAIVTQLGDRYVLTRASLLAEAGYYAAIYDVASRATTLLLAPWVMATHAPIMQARIAAGSKVGSRIRSTALLAQSLILMIAGSLVAVGGKVMLDFVGAPTGIQWRYTLIMVFVGTGVFQVAQVAHKRQEAAGRTGPLAGYMVAVAIGNMSANWWFAPRYGAPAAAAITLLSALVYLLLVTADSRVRADQS